MLNAASVSQVCLTDLFKSNQKEKKMPVIVGSFARVYHAYDRWEELEAGMWGTISDKKRWLALAIEFTSNHLKYGFYMQRVVRGWPISCENALTDSNLNQKAWIGHAACAMAIRCPEYITREAWGKLTDEQRILANQEASRAIQLWRHDYAKSRGLYCQVGS